MASIRHKNRADDDVVLDAARDCVLAVGVRRTTLTEVARRAGMSRMTIYRRWPDVRSLVGDLMTREWVNLAREAEDAAAGESARERGVAAIAAAVSALTAHPLWRKIVDVDPELLLPYLLHRLGSSQHTMIGMTARIVREGQADGSVRAGDPAVLARAVFLTAQSFALSAGVAGAPPEELAALLDRYLRP
ncbi:TetR/AcrR family transcriptional regulator [Bailinhaonella thermotolerans]|uniref:TetR/AcrR family transcriptional regulator n=1 Tax=Bailinhaonella thermotolerans TaxID=1070861 RepID=A0A3A4AVB1_9ACTN|nr:TetR/AcrR family transcriptional regulator [Bailinhaonella thermotolerans]RJL34170.1 TetR/AcrR family transcriptional regulator [Bailinhaonella thermotolerans]